MDKKFMEKVISLITPNKQNHTLGTIKAASELALFYGANLEDAQNSALLHDITKHLNKNEQLALCEKYGIILGNVERANPKLLHAITASEIARDTYNMNESVCRAIRFHTTLCDDMTLLDKIIYVADYIEENRSFDGVDKARELAFISIDETLRYCLDTTILEIIKKGDLLHLDTIKARNYLYQTVEA